MLWVRNNNHPKISKLWDSETGPTTTTTHMVQDLVEAFKNPAPRAPFANVGTKALETFRQLSNIFKTQSNTALLPTTTETATAAPSLRVTTEAP